MVHWYLHHGHRSCCGSVSIIPALLSTAAAELDQYIGAATVVHASVPGVGYSNHPTVVVAALWTSTAGQRSTYMNEVLQTTPSSVT